MSNTAKQTRTYRDENGDIKWFDHAKFKNTFSSNRRAEGMKVEEYQKKLADEMSCSPDTIDGWKKGKNAPLDIETVYELERKLDLSKGELLYSEITRLEDKIQSYQNEINTLRLKLQEVSIRENSIKQKDFQFIECMTPFCLRYDGFSNLIDMIIGFNLRQENENGYMASTYAEELSYLLDEYIRTDGISQVLGYKCNKTKEELADYIKASNITSDEEFFKAVNGFTVDKKGNPLFDESNQPTFHGFDLFKKIKSSPLLKRGDKRRVKALLNEMLDSWKDYECPYATLSITITINDIEIKKYCIGPGFIKETYKDRMDVITDLFFLVNGKIDTLTIENATRLHVDQFEQELEISFDLSKINIWY